MPTELSLKYGGGGHTLLHPAALAFLFVAGILILLLPRRHVMVPVLAGCVFIPTAQRIVISGLDLMAPRILVLVGLFRMVIRGEVRAVKLDGIDRMLMLYVSASVVAYTLLFGAWGAFVNRLGFAFDVLGFYFLVRLIAKDHEDIQRIIQMLVVLSVPVSMFMLVEQASGRNLFAVLGGVPEVAAVRGGGVRSQGAFSHPITAGIFGATLFPLAVGLWWSGNSRRLGLVGGAAAAVIVFASGSGGPVAALLAGILGLWMWPWRRYMRPIRWGVVGLLLGAHMLMKAPVWALLDRVPILGGASWHRYIIVDQFIRRFDEWWLLGVRSTAHWGWYTSTDITNMYVAEAISGGIVVLILFIMVLVRCFQGVGRAVRSVEDAAKRKGAWALGVSLFAHVVAFFGVAYFGQIQLIWYVLLAMISIASSSSGSRAETNGRRWPAPAFATLNVHLAI